MASSELSDGVEEQAVMFWKAPDHLCCCLNKLDKIDMKSFSGSKLEKEFINFVLASSPGLEKAPDDLRWRFNNLRTLEINSFSHSEPEWKFFDFIYTSQHPDIEMVSVCQGLVVFKFRRASSDEEERGLVDEDDDVALIRKSRKEEDYDEINEFSWDAYD